MPLDEWSEITAADMSIVVSFLDPNGDGVTPEELESCFNSSRNYRTRFLNERDGKLLLGKLLEYLKDESKTPEQWFNESNTDGGEIGEEDEAPSLDTSEFCEAIKKTKAFRATDVEVFRAFLDPDDDGDVELSELMVKVESIEKPSLLPPSEVKIGEIMEKLEGNMALSFLTVADLNKKTGQDGSIEHTVLKAWLEGFTKPSEASEARKKMALEMEASSKPLSLTEPDPNTPITDEEVKQLMAFLDPDKNGITIDELIAGFREGRKARATAVAEAEGKILLDKVFGKVQSDGKDLRKWFDEVNGPVSANNKKEPVLDERELKRGFKALKLNFSPAEMRTLIRYCDPSGDGDISFGELAEAVDAINKPSRISNFYANAGTVIMQLENHMTKNKMRMIDLFRVVDKDSSGDIDYKELLLGLKQICTSSGPVPKKPITPRKLEEAKALDGVINKAPSVATE